MSNQQSKVNGNVKDIPVLQKTSPYEPLKDPIFLANQLMKVLQEEGHETRPRFNKDRLENPGEFIGEDYHSLHINVFRNEEITVNLTEEEIYRGAYTGNETNNE